MSGLMRAFRMRQRPRLPSSDEWASKLKAQAISTIEARIGRFARGGDEIGAADGAEFGADQDRGAALTARSRPSMKRPSAPIQLPGQAVERFES